MSGQANEADVLTNASSSSCRNFRRQVSSREGARPIPRETKRGTWCLFFSFSFIFSFPPSPVLPDYPRHAAIRATPMPPPAFLIKPGLRSAERGSLPWSKRP